MGGVGTRVARNHPEECDLDSGDVPRGAAGGGQKVLLHLTDLPPC